MYPNDNVAYAYGRLVQTIIRYEGKAVEVVDVQLVARDRPLRIISSVILTGEIVSDSIDNYDLTPVKLGWVNNYNNLTTSYLTRAPVRQDWRQGFRPHTARVFVRPMDGRKVDVFDKHAIAKTIEGQFPPFGEVISKLKKNRIKGTALAWCRDFSMTAMGEIMYKMYGKVGNFIDGTILLDEQYVWVEESLREVY